MNDLKLSLIFGVLARVVTLLNQILTVPLVIALIGLAEFTRYNVMTAGVAWLITFGGCLLPSIIGDIARAKVDGNNDIISEKVSSSLALMSIFCLLVIVIYIIGFHSKNIEYHVLVLLSLLILLTSTAESIRQGLSENYKNSIYNGIANFLVLLCVYALYYLKVNTNITTILLVSLGSIALLKLANLVPLLKMFSIRKIEYNSCKEMIRKALGFVFLSIAYYFNTAGIVTILGFSNFSKLTEFVVLQKLMLIIMGVVIMIRNPLWSIIAKMSHSGSKSKVFSYYNKIVKIYLLLSPLIFLIFWLTLSPFLNMWAKGVTLKSFEIVMFSIYIVIIIFSYINSILYYGLELFNIVSKFLVMEAFFNVALVISIVNLELDLGYIFLVMTCTSLLINYIILKIIKRTCLNV